LENPGALCRQVGLGGEPRKELVELKDIELAEAVLPTGTGREIHRHGVSRPAERQGPYARDPDGRRR
jgi:hypothetical protein